MVFPSNEADADFTRALQQGFCLWETHNWFALCSRAQTSKSAASLLFKKSDRARLENRAVLVFFDQTKRFQLLQCLILDPAQYFCACSFTQAENKENGRHGSLISANIIVLFRFLGVAPPHLL